MIALLRVLVDANASPRATMALRGTLVVLSDLASPVSGSWAAYSLRAPQAPIATLVWRLRPLRSDKGKSRSRHGADRLNVIIDSPPVDVMIEAPISGICDEGTIPESQVSNNVYDCEGSHGGAGLPMPITCHSNDLLVPFAGEWAAWGAPLNWQWVNIVTIITGGFAQYGWLAASPQGMYAVRPELLVFFVDEWEPWTPRRYAVCSFSPERLGTESAAADQLLADAPYIIRPVYRSTSQPCMTGAGCPEIQHPGYRFRNNGPPGGEPPVATRCCELLSLRALSALLIFVFIVCITRSTAPPTTPGGTPR